MQTRLAIRRLRPLLAVVAILISPPLGAAPGGLQRVLILNSYGRDFAPYATIASTFRTELAQLSPKPVEFFEVSLETVRFETPEEIPIVEYVRALCKRRTFDLVVPNGAPATRFWLRHRDSLLPSTPTLIAAVEERHLRDLPLPLGVTGVVLRIDTQGDLRHILEVLPETRNVFVIIGDSPLERFWLSELRRDWQPFEGRVQLNFLNNLSFDEMLQRTATLPSRSAIFFALMLMDAAGVPHEQGATVDKLHATANAAIFGWSDDLLGRGIVGGPLIRLEAIGREVARSAMRILAGESPETVGRSLMEAGPPVYDWRELRAWKIDPGRLRPDHETRFHPPSILRNYRWPILIALGLIVVQALAITGLLVSRHRRREAEEETLRLRRELAHAGRVSVVGQLSSSLAHELNQPLGAILRNAEAAELFLEASPPNLDEVRAILSDIRKDDHRAGSVIDGIRALLRRHDMEVKPVHLDAIVDAVVALVRPDAQSRGVSLSIEMPPGLPTVRGNQVQLQQVLLNLMINGMDAMAESPDGRRWLTVRGQRLDGGLVEIAVRDSGPGISPEEIPHIFQNFYTTKPGGMGMGLAICRRIVEAHGGEIKAENAVRGGATLRVTLPAEGVET